jgi:hypothetical protein
VTTFPDDYATALSKAVASMMRLVDISLFTGWVRGYFEQFSRCCTAPIYVRSLMEGEPYCSKCHHLLLDEQIRYEWVPPRKIDHDTTSACPWPIDPEPR